MRLRFLVSTRLVDRRRGEDNLREKVVDNVVGDDVVEQVSANPAKVAVDGGKRALDVGPRLGLVVVHLGVVVVEVGDGHEPVVDPHVRHDVEESNRLPPVDGGAVVQSARGQGQAQVGESNEDSLVGPEYGRGGLEVAKTEPTRSLALQAALAGRGVGQEVRLPSDQLVEEQLDCLDDGGVLEEIGVNVQVREALARSVGKSLGHEGHVLLHVAGEAVVAVVAELPAEVGDEERGVHGPAHDVVELGVDREGAVAALVAQDPDADTDEALDVAIGDPGGGAPERVLDLGDVGQSRPAQGEGHGIIADDIAHGAGDRGLEAVLWDPALDGLDIGEFLPLSLLELDGSGGSSLGSMVSVLVELAVTRDFMCRPAQHHARSV